MVKFQILVPRGNVRIGTSHGNGGPALETNPADKRTPVASPEGESSEPQLSSSWTSGRVSPSKTTLAPCHMPVSLAETAMTIHPAMVGTVTRHRRNGTLLWLITIPDPAVVTSNPKYLENQDGTGLCPSEEHEKAPRRKHRPRGKITDVEQIGAGLKRNDVEGLHMETDATVDNSITSSSRVNETLTTPFHSSVRFDSPELPCAGILIV